MNYMEAWKARELKEAGGEFWDIIPTGKADDYELVKVVDENVKGKEIIFNLEGA